MMLSQKAAIAALLLPFLVFTACTGSSPEEELQVSGAKSGFSVFNLITGASFRQNRPSSPLGIFAGLYLTQGVFLPVKSAVLGMDVMQVFLEALSQSDTDENFALLREIGDVLQVNIVDTLNRSQDRAQTLDDYTLSLRNAIILLERKLAELEALLERQTEDSREKRSRARDVDRELKTALRDQQYSEAGALEEELARANAEYAEISTKSDQTGDMIDRMATLMEIGQERLRAIENNREILIAGLKVIDVPGIEDLNILERDKRWSARGGSGIFGN